MFIGEAPGKNEDLKGEPFVGRRRASCSTSCSAHRASTRDDVYIANVLKCRPPGNRDPEADEIETCTPFLREQIRAHRARGDRHARQLRDEVRAARPRPASRGCAARLQQAGGFTVLPIFHPAAAIYDRTKRDALFDDFDALRGLLGRSTPSRPTTRRRARPSPARPRCSERRAASHADRAITIATASEAATQAVGARAGRRSCAPGDVVVLSGDLGAGKTQLTKGLAAGLGVAEPVTSPTFNILLVHEGRIPLYHFDLYRLESAEQLEDLDYWGTLEADGVSVVEWGDRFPEAMPERRARSCASASPATTSRALELEPRGARGAALAARGRRRARSCRRRGRGRGRALVSRILLALDTATERTAVGVARLDDGARSRCSARRSSTRRGRRCRALLPMAESLLAAQRPRRSRDVDARRRRPRAGLVHRRAHRRGDREGARARARRAAVRRGHARRDRVGASRTTTATVGGAWATRCAARSTRRCSAAAAGRASGSRPTAWPSRPTSPREWAALGEPLAARRQRPAQVRGDLRARRWASDALIADEDAVGAVGAGLFSASWLHAARERRAGSGDPADAAAGLHAPLRRRGGRGRARGTRRRRAAASGRVGR